MILVVFRSRNRPDGDLEEYSRRSKRLHELVEQHPGFISIESFETPDGEEVSLELFESDKLVKAWRDNPEHRETQRWAREHFYSWYSAQVSEVIRFHEVDLMERKGGGNRLVASATGAEEVLQQCGGFAVGDTAGHVDPVVVVRIAEHVVHAAVGTLLRIASAIDTRGDARLHHRPGAHRTRLQRGIDA